MCCSEIQVAKLFVEFDAQKSVRFWREQIWVGLACLKSEEKGHLKLWVKLGCYP